MRHGGSASATGRLRLAYVLDRYPSPHQTFVADEIAALRALGHEVVVGSFASVGGEQTAQDAPVIVLPRSPPVLLLHLVRALAVRPTAVAKIGALAGRAGPRGVVAMARGAALHRLAAVAAPTAGDSGPNEAAGQAALPARLRAGSWRPDHVHAHFALGANVAAWTAATLWRVPFSFTTHAVDLYTRPIALCPSLAAAAFGITISNYNRHFIARACPGADAAVIHAGIVVEDFAPPPGVERAGVLSIGRLVPKKGHAVLVQALALLAHDGRQVPATIVGSGPDAEPLARRTAELGLAPAVRLAGALNRADVRRLLWGAQVFALACAIGPDGDRDGIPVALMEALAAELPVVTTTVSGISELLGAPGGEVAPGVRVCAAGLVVPPDDPAALARALVVLLDDAALRAQLAHAGRRRVAEAFDVRRETARLARAFERAAATRS